MTNIKSVSIDAHSFPDLESSEFDEWSYSSLALPIQTHTFEIVNFHSSSTNQKKNSMYESKRPKHDNTRSRFGKVLIMKYVCENLVELNLSFTHLKFRQVIYLRDIPASVKRLTLVNTKIVLLGISSLNLDRFCILRSSFKKGLTFERADIFVQVKEIVIYSIDKEDYVPTWTMLNKVIDGKSKKIIFGKFDWQSKPTEGVDRDALISYGVLENHENFSLNFETLPWTGKSIYRDEEKQILDEVSEKFKIPRDKGSKSVSLTTDADTEPNLFAGNLKYVNEVRELNEEFKEPQLFSTLKEPCVDKIFLENVKIDASSFFIRLKNCKKLVSICFLFSRQYQVSDAKRI